MNKDKNREKHSPLGLASLAVIMLGIIFTISIGPSPLLSNVLNEQGKLMCFTQGEIDEELAEVRAQKNALEDQRMQTRLQEESLKEKIQANSLSLESARVEAEAAQKEVLSEEEMARREKEVTDLLVQMGEKEALEGLKKDMDSKMSIAASDEKKALDLLALVGPAQRAYDALLVQYNLKKELGVLANELKTLPLPTSAQRNARKTLEAQALAADPAKRPSDVQISDRKKLEELLIARDAAKRNIPASNKAPGYQAAVNTYNTLKNKYSADLATYRSTYASSAFGVNLTFAQLTAKRDQHTKAQSTYTGSLTSYNATYPTNSTLTLVQLNELVAAHNTAKSTLATKQATYNTQYPTTKNKTLEQLGVLLNGPNGVKTKYDTVNNAYLVGQKTSETSKTVSELARDSYGTAERVYGESHPGDTRTAAELGKAHGNVKKVFDELVVSNDAKKVIYAGLETKRKEFEDIGVQLNEQMVDVMELLESIGGKLSPLEEKIVSVEAQKCPETEQGLCGDLNDGVPIDNDRDGVANCADSECTSDPVCTQTQCPDGTTVRYGEPCVTSMCGDGTPQGAEVCDDGNTVNGDGCRGDCGEVTTYCGDGYTQSPNSNWQYEQCDDKDKNGGEYACSSSCTLNTGYGSASDAATGAGNGAGSCGNGVCDPSETPGSCPGECFYDNMGNVDTGTMPQIEGCMDPRAPNYDPAAVVSNGTCDPFCGDGTKNTVPEQDPGGCDDGNKEDNDACSNACVEQCPVLVQNNVGNGGLFASFLTPPSSAPSSNTHNGFVGRLQRWISSLFSPFLGSSALYNGEGKPMYTTCKLGCTDPLASNYDSEATTDDGSCVYHNNEGESNECSEPEKPDDDDKLNDLKTCNICFYAFEDPKIDFAKECSRIFKKTDGFNYDDSLFVATFDRDWKSQNIEGICGTNKLQEVNIEIEEHSCPLNRNAIFNKAEEIIQNYHSTGLRKLSIFHRGCGTFNGVADTYGKNTEDTTKLEATINKVLDQDEKYDVRKSSIVVTLSGNQLIDRTSTDEYSTNYSIVFTGIRDPNQCTLSGQEGKKIEKGKINVDHQEFLFLCPQVNDSCSNHSGWSNKIVCQSRNGGIQFMECNSDGSEKVRDDGTIAGVFR